LVYDGIIIGLIVGLIRGGSLAGIANLRLRYGWVFPVLLISQFFVYFTQETIEIIKLSSNYIFILVYIIGLFFLWLNRSHSGFSVIFIGVALNFIVMAVNGGRMPVSLEAAMLLDPYYANAIENGLYGKHMILSENTNLAFLGDIIPLTPPYPREQIISIGDVMMNIGIFLFIQHTILLQRKKSVRTI
jgi:hypothetical protein